jgi:PadR family transcriptional regulator PadR
MFALASALITRFPGTAIAWGAFLELAHHGYRIGQGALYPLLHGLERSGLLKSVLKNVGGHSRRVYKTTAAGKKALDKARAKVDELHHELHEEHPRELSKLVPPA